MGHIDQFSAGPVTPVAAYLVACVGSVLGLVCTTRAHGAHGWARRRWFALGAFAIGGTGIWATHFVAMLGFSVEGTPIRYDVTLTLTSLVLAIGVVGVGLSVAARDVNRPALLAVGGAVTGCGIATMHYVGMAAMRMRGSTSYDAGTVVVSVGVAMVAATIALYAALNVRSPGAILGAALAMGVAVGGMHYTAMTAVSVHLHGPTDTLKGADSPHLLAPLVVGLTVCTVVALFMVGWHPQPADDEPADEEPLPPPVPTSADPVTIERILQSG
ncbi:MHYT domain-containing protein [Yinghuangia seranimata]|uniref:MHYT domain-containing protein n=1 Tax=Yinghuangia seranimata TaxID=408067 RepID=UPI00248C82C3|nr:MHYT domain-containing protein [Yinghuangia seranimata]MDI2132167.1 MHYT domain-containing protein [Yinghuangia seranimata]